MNYTGSSYPGKEERFLVVANDASKFKVPYKQLRYIETKGRNVLLHYKKQHLTFYKSMKETVMMLKNETMFAQCHASFLVNLSYITSMEDMEAVLSTGERIPISHPKRKAFMLRLAEYWSM